MDVAPHEVWDVNGRHRGPALAAVLRLATGPVRVCATERREVCLAHAHVRRSGVELHGPARLGDGDLGRDLPGRVDRNRYAATGRPEAARRREGDGLAREVEDDL